MKIDDKMKRMYRISWFSNKDKMQRSSWIKLSKPTGDTGIDAKSALNIFTSQFGSLKYNTIIKIQEFNENGTQLGEDIVPQEDTSFIPIV